MERSSRDVVNEIRMNHYFLFGQVTVSDIWYDELIEWMSIKCTNLYISTIIKSDLLLSLALVQIAIRCYSDGNFWRTFSKQINRKLSTPEQNYLGEIFIKTIRDYNMLELNQERNQNTSYVENIKAHAFVTNSYMSGFFDFADAYYNYNLFRKLPKKYDMLVDISALSLYMKDALKTGMDEEILVEGRRKTRKSYRLLKSTRAVFAQCEPENIINLFYPILCLLNAYFYEQYIPIKAKNRFEQGFVDWCVQKENNSLDERKRNQTVHRINGHMPFIKIIPKSEAAYLIIPKQKYSVEECDGTAFVNIMIANDSVIKKPLEIYRSFGIYISEEVCIPIQNIFGAIEVEINSSMSAIKTYSIKEDKYRILNEKWENIYRFTKGDMRLLVKNGTEVSWKNTKDVKRDLSFKNWNYYFAAINDASRCYLDGQPIFGGEFFVETNFEDFIEWVEVYRNDEKINAVKRHPFISFVVDECKISGTAIEINCRKYFLCEIENMSCNEWQKDDGKIIVTVDIGELLYHEDGFFVMFLNIPSEKRKKICEYIVLSKFFYKWNKSCYIYDSEAELTINHGEMDLDILCDDYYISAGRSEVSTTYAISITSSLSKVIFESYMSESIIHIVVPIPIFKYGFSRDDMRVERPKYIWYADVGEILYVELPGASNLDVYWGREYSDLVRGEKKGGYFKVVITPLLDKIRKEKGRWQYMNIRNDKMGDISLPAILRLVEIYPYFNLNFYAGRAYMNIEEIKGSARIYLTVKGHNSDDIIIDQQEIVKGKNEFLELTLDGFYDLYPIMIESDDFGFEEINTPLQIKRGVGYADTSNLEKSRLSVSNIIYKGKEIAWNEDNEYVVDVKRKIEGERYQGILKCIKYERRNKKKAIEIGKIDMQLYSMGKKIGASLRMYSDGEKEWFDPYYDSSGGIILNPDDELLNSNQNHKRFLLLESEEDTRFVFDKRIV